MARPRRLECLDRLCKAQAWTQLSWWGVRSSVWGAYRRRGRTLRGVEACEAYDSFHDLDPFLVVLTNLEMDHVDFHGTFDSLKMSVSRFISNPSEGCLVFCETTPGQKKWPRATMAGSWAMR